MLTISVVEITCTCLDIDTSSSGYLLLITLKLQN